MTLRSRVSAIATLSCICVVCLVGCEPAKTRIPVAKISGSAVAAKAMQLYDANKDGKISGAELEKAPALKASLEIMNTDATKGIAAEQITARIDRWAQDKKGLIPVNCFIAHHGKPLADAEIKFVPDPCISDYLTQTCEGKTNSDGEAQISIPREEGSDLPPGVPPGLYRVEVTKSGEKIPAQYNTATTLGQEISTDSMLKSALERKRMQFDLKY